MKPTLLVPGNISLFEDNGKVVDPKIYETETPVNFIIETVYKSWKQKGENFAVLDSKTGSGKSTVFMTELYQFWRKMEGEDKNIVNLQPRIVSAKSIPQDLSSASWNDLTIKESLGIMTGDFKIVPRGYNLSYYSYGYLLRLMIALGTEEALSRIGVLVCDEAHDDTMELLVFFRLLKTADQKKLPLVVLTSATLNKDKYMNYFPLCKKFFKVEGIQFTKHKFSLTDDKVRPTAKDIAQIVKNIIEKDHEKLSQKFEPTTDLNLEQAMSDVTANDILIFVSSAKEIENVKEACAELLPGYSVVGVNRERVKSEAIDYQEAISTTHKPKVIVGTPAIEVGITLEQLGYVINLGWEFTNVYMGSSCWYLTRIPIAKSSYIQRLGRIGRKFPGIAFDLFSKQCVEEMPEDKMSIMVRQRIDGNLLGSMLDDVPTHLDKLFVEEVPLATLKITVNAMLTRRLIKKVAGDKFVLTKTGEVIKRMLCIWNSLTVDDAWLLLAASRIGPLTLDKCLFVISFLITHDKDRDQEERFAVNTIGTMYAYLQDLVEKAAEKIFLTSKVINDDEFIIASTKYRELTAEKQKIVDKVIASSKFNLLFWMTTYRRMSIEAKLILPIATSGDDDIQLEALSNIAYLDGARTYSYSRGRFGPKIFS